MAVTRILLISVFCIIYAVYGHEADFIRPCTWDDEKCILTSSQHAIPFVAGGVETLGVPVLDPLILKPIKVDEDGLELFFKEMKVTGLSECQMQSLSRDKKPSKISMVIDCPIEAVCEYTVAGKLLFVPIDGAGPCKIKSDKLRVSVVFDIDVVDGNDGKKHWKIKNIEHTYEPLEKFYLTFENLCDGNTKKAEPILKILDNNWEEMILSVGKPFIKEIVFQIIANGVGKLFDKIPAEHLEIAS